MKLTWSPQALRDLAAVHATISPDDPTAAGAVIGRILSLIERLSMAPQLGRPGRVAGTRELVIPRTPFIVPYGVSATAVEVLRVYHAARRWPAALER